MRDAGTSDLREDKDMRFIIATNHAADGVGSDSGVDAWRLDP
ncbi:hypothetical protein [Microbacterium paulum]